MFIMCREKIRSNMRRIGLVVTTDAFSVCTGLSMAEVESIVLSYLQA